MSMCLCGVGDVSTLAGSGTQTYADGTGSAASFYLVYGLCADLLGNVMAVDNGNHRIRKIASSGANDFYVKNYFPINLAALYVFS